MEWREMHFEGQSNGLEGHLACVVVDKTTPFLVPWGARPQVGHFLLCVSGWPIALVGFKAEIGTFRCSGGLQKTFLKWGKTFPIWRFYRLQEGKPLSRSVGHWCTKFGNCLHQIGLPWLQSLGIGLLYRITQQIPSGQISRAKSSCQHVRGDLRIVGKCGQWGSEQCQKIFNPKAYWKCPSC